MTREETVREYTVPPLVKPADDEGLADVVFEKAARVPDDVVFGRQFAGAWQDITYAEFAAAVRAAAKGLLAAGIRPGDRVLVLGRTSYEWSVADFAVLSVGAVTVPVYPTSSAEQIRHLVADSRPSACFAETAEQAALIAEVAGDVHARCWLLGSLEELARSGLAITDEDAEARRAAVRADDLATIVYTSGTTGLPKGCLLTHRNVLAAAANVVELLHEVFRPTTGEPASTVLFLPLAHVYGRVTQFGCVWGGVRTGLVATPAELLGALPSFRPSFLVGVPYLLEKIRKVARTVVGEDGFAAVDAAAVALGHARRHGGGSDHDTPPEFAAAREKLRGLLGGRLEYVIAGGASLEPSTADFFAGLGVEVLGAYGLTEASSTVSMSAPGANRPHAVGRPVPGTTVAISDDGEILVRGDQVFPGYWPDRAGAPAPWLASGDVGLLDDDGYLHLTGRRKELIVTSGGKNVVPAPLEGRVRLHPLVSNCLLVGEARPFVTALITLDPPALAGWRETHDSSEGEPTADPRLLREIATAVDSANELVSRAESIRRFTVLPEDFSVAKGQLTASLRLRRHVIEEQFQDEISLMYSG
ncbi:AMP-dependent synthetase/ligase [Amycolatopsis rhabdoformis]|uniref:AMP-dependent synthetase/ligase n=1 Tax=Amycolatopsis rhabdoformis TaxID=1448059 RepID=A0ABZ1IFN2_9PSEU|nr:AMP-dependent synthetase/ligase [Amycolatopsis rhabdoformis]WSE33241.1 AMP-dependent synthetase/ligase [Amycolatopsis rhabdoformis]